MPRRDVRLAYQYNELSAAAKEKAIESTRQDESYLSYNWWDMAYDDFVAMAAAIGIEVDKEETYFDSLYCQSQSAGFKARYYYAKGWQKNLKNMQGQTDMLYRVEHCGHRLQAAQLHHNYQASASTFYRDRYGQVTEVELYSDTYPTAERTICSVMNHMAKTLETMIIREYEHLTSDETIKWNIEANNWEFTKDGHCFY